MHACEWRAHGGLVKAGQLPDLAAGVDEEQHRDGIDADGAARTGVLAEQRLPVVAALIGEAPDFCYAPDCDTSDTGGDDGTTPAESNSAPSRSPDSPGTFDGHACPEETHWHKAEAHRRIQGCGGTALLRTTEPPSLSVDRQVGGSFNVTREISMDVDTKRRQVLLLSSAVIGQFVLSRSSFANAFKGAPSPLWTR
jgi:hypothetical protein